MVPPPAQACSPLGTTSPAPLLVQLPLRLIPSPRGSLRVGPRSHHRVRLLGPLTETDLAVHGLDARSHRRAQSPIPLAGAVCVALLSYRSQPRPLPAAPSPKPSSHRNCCKGAQCGLLSAWQIATVQKLRISLFGTRLKAPVEFVDNLDNLISCRRLLLLLLLLTACPRSSARPIAEGPRPAWALLPTCLE